MTSAQLSQNPFGQNNRDGRGRLTKEESTKRAFTFSLIAHLGLVAFLVIGISWNNSTPAGVEVELWDSTQQVETPPAPELKTEMKEEAADIAVKKKPVEKEPPKKEKEAIKEPPKPVKAAPPKEVPKKVELPKKAEAPKPAALTPAQIKANAEADKRREANIASLRGMAANDGGKGGVVGTGIGSGGTSKAGWREKIVREVLKNKPSFNASSIPGNPSVTIAVKLAPDGTILDRKVVSSSGYPAWDNVVLQSFDKIEKLPKDDDGTIPDKNLELKFKPND